MLLLGALFALFVAGFWLYCVTDVALTPGSECPGLPKVAWLVIVAAAPVAGAVAWLVARRPAWAVPVPPGTVPAAGGGQPPGPYPAGRDGPAFRDGPDFWDGPPGGPGWDGPGNGRSLEAEAALLRHPAGRSRQHGGPGEPVPLGPDDDQEFLRNLDRAIHGSQPGEEPQGGPGNGE